LDDKTHLNSLLHIGFSFQPFIHYPIDKYRTDKPSKKKMKTTVMIMSLIVGATLPLPRTLEKKTIKTYYEIYFSLAEPFNLGYPFVNNYF